MTEWECGNGHSYEKETEGEPPLPCIHCNSDNWSKVKNEQTEVEE